MKYVITGFALLLVIGYGVWQWTPATFTVRNESGQVIHLLKVEVGGKTFQYEDIPPGGEVSGSFHVDHEEVFNLRGRFADSQEFSDFCGYVVWEEFAPHTTIVVCQGGKAEVRR